MKSEEIERREKTIPTHPIIVAMTSSHIHWHSLPVELLFLYFCISSLKEHSISLTIEVGWEREREGQFAVMNDLSSLQLSSKEGSLKQREDLYRDSLLVETGVRSFTLCFNKTGERQAVMLLINLLHFLLLRHGSKFIWVNNNFLDCVNDQQTGGREGQQRTDGESVSEWLNEMRLSSWCCSVWSADENFSAWFLKAWTLVMLTARAELGRERKKQRDLCPLPLIDWSIPGGKMAKRV